MRSLIIKSCLLSCLFIFIGQQSASAQSEKKEVKEFPSTWVNNAPLTVEGLKGKLVVLYFYEEDCPSCRGKWPARLESAAKYQDKPVVFIAVNSGNQKNEVESYLKSVKCAWPTIVDTDRSFEKLCIDGEISLQNIYQCRVITPDGKLMMGNASDIESSVDKYVDKATWRIDPKEVPDAVKPVWKQLEVGNMSTATKALAQVRKSKLTTEEKASADRLATTITDEFNKVFSKAKADFAEGNKWASYKQLKQAKEMFDGLDEAKKVATVMSKMEGDKMIANELKAARMFQSNRSLIEINNPDAQKRGIKGMEQLAKDFSDTEFGAKAKKGLEDREKAGAK